MSSNSLDKLLDSAEQMLEKGERKNAGLLIDRVLKQDFTNEKAWKLLYHMSGSNRSLEEFKHAFARKYYPYKLHLLEPSFQNYPKTQDLTNEVEPTIAPVRPVRQTKKCPYCAEEILVDARVCRFCNRDLTNNKSSQKGLEEHSQLTMGLEKLEKKLVAYERFIQEQMQTAQEAGRQETFAWIATLIGLLLTPVVIGFIIAPIALYQALVQRTKRKHAQYDQLEANKDVEGIKQQVIEVRSKLAALKE